MNFIDSLLRHDIVCAIMNRKKLRKVMEAMETLRRKVGIKSSELEAAARSVGRTLHGRGKEPTWVNLRFPDLRPISIPHHSKELNRFTANNIINQLEEDIVRHEEIIED